MQIIEKYFPHLTPEQKQQFAELAPLYTEWNERINVISRKDMESFYEHHVLHSLAIAKVITFKGGTEILDIGTGGGFPGIPLAIMFPDVKFHLVDSIGKKIKVVTEVAIALGLKNVTATHCRAENINASFDFIISRAVTRMARFNEWTHYKIRKRGFNDLDNGILYLKGGDIEEELKEVVSRKAHIYPISKMFSEPFFETKKVVHLV